MNFYGFNFQWMYNRDQSPKPQAADERALDFLAKFGFNFVRLPVDYRFWTEDFDYLHPDESAFKYIDEYISACRSRGIHLCLNLHRAPGYCTNRNDLERHNLWLDDMAQKAFVFLWETFARRYKNVPAGSLSFDLLNEPPHPGEFGMTRESHAALIRRTVAAIHRVDEHRTVVINGLGGGFLAMPELANLDVIHSGRGYLPMPVSHHQAGWWSGHRNAPQPRYPWLWWQGRLWNRNTLRNSYKCWRDVEKLGARIHIGEFGCFNRTPNDIATRWLSDLLGIYKEFRWGYAMWHFQGAFGLINHGRPGAMLELMAGYRVDRALLDLLLEHQTA